MTLRHSFLALSAALSAALLAGCAAQDAELPSDTTKPVAETTTADQATLAETTMRLPSGLEGTFLDAGSGKPAVLIVPGSGPTDRNGNSPLGLSGSMFTMMADGLANAGISSLRVDKRGMFGSAAAGDGNAVTVDIYARDYADWAAALRETTGNDCVYLLGHSEGGMMVSAAALLGSEGICGVILAAAPGRRLGRVLREQLETNPANAPLLDDARDAIARIEAGEDVDVSGFHPALQGMFAPAVQDFLKSTFAVDPARQVRALVDSGVPVLVLQGSTDIQVTMEDAERLERAGGELVRLRGLSHLLKPAPTDRAAHLATYGDPDLPLGREVVPAIAQFIAAQE